MPFLPLPFPLVINSPLLLPLLLQSIHRRVTHRFLSHICNRTDMLHLAITQGTRTPSCISQEHLAIWQEHLAKDTDTDTDTDTGTDTAGEDCSFSTSQHFASLSSLFHYLFPALQLFFFRWKTGKKPHNTNKYPFCTEPLKHSL